MPCWVIFIIVSITILHIFVSKSASWNYSIIVDAPENSPIRDMYKLIIPLVAILHLILIVPFNYCILRRFWGCFPICQGRWKWLHFMQQILSGGINMVQRDQWTIVTPWLLNLLGYTKLLFVHRLNTMAVILQMETVPSAIGPKAFKPEKKPFHIPGVTSIADLPWLVK